MPDREKIESLKQCLSASCRGFRTCPYNDTEWDAIETVLELLAEHEPVAHAAWLRKETSTAYDLYGVKTWAARYKCSKCGFVHRAIEAHMSYSYCPSCGARMDEEIKGGTVE